MQPADPGLQMSHARELCPTGILRFGVVIAPEPTSFFVTRTTEGAPVGVTVDLAQSLARSLGLTVTFVVVPNSGELVQGLVDGTIDAAFMPIDDQRRKQVDFGPAYTFAENTYLIRGSSQILSLADVDQAHVRVIGIANTTTIRSAAGLLKNTTITPVESVGGALDRLRAGTSDALALTRDALAPLMARVPGARILDETFRQVSIAIAIPNGRAGALACVTDWLESVKALGVVRQVLDKAGFVEVPVAPALERAAPRQAFQLAGQVMPGTQLLRSLLFVPGARPEFFAKAAASGADALIFDLEDSVAMHTKPDARRNVAAALREAGERLSFVRVNHPAAGMLQEDLAVLAPHPLQAILLPKVEHVDEVKVLDALLLDFERQHALAPHSISVVVVVESNLGLRNLFELVGAATRVRGAALASAEEGDLMVDLGGQWDPEGTALAYARGKFVCDARAAGAVWLLDGAFMNLSDAEALERESRLARRYGFTGKTAIHPRQVTAMNNVFSPTAAQITRARRMLDAFRAAEARGHGAVQFEGMMIDYANVRLAEQILAFDR